MTNMSRKPSIAVEVKPPPEETDLTLIVFRTNDVVAYAETLADRIERLTVRLMGCEVEGKGEELIPDLPASLVNNLNGHLNAVFAQLDRVSRAVQRLEGAI